MPSRDCQRDRQELPKLLSIGSCAGLPVSSVILGARNEEQLLQNLAATGWKLTPEQVARLDSASESLQTYPYWHQRTFPERIRCLFLEGPKLKGSDPYALLLPAATQGAVNLYEGDISFSRDWERLSSASR